MNTEKHASDNHCFECQVGHMVERQVAHAIWMEDALIMVPDFPAWVCDVCGRLEFDARAINRLNLVLNSSLNTEMDNRPYSIPPDAALKTSHPGWTG